MKKVQFVTGWTDYPFVELGDEPNQIAPIRQVNVISYDNNKYATVSFADNSFHLEVKLGYLYSKRGRLGQVKQINPNKIRRAFGRATWHRNTWEKNLKRIWR